jgi:F0F1-type ATP synthase assembly protein I
MRGEFAFLGALMVGVGVGMLLGHTGAGAVIGLGVGFILWGLMAGFARGSREE